MGTVTATQPPHAASVEKQDESHGGTQPGRRVLVVDDNVDAAEMLSMALDAHGHVTAIAHDGQRALQLFEQFHPDVALLDIGLPLIDGYQLARELRQRPSGRNVKLVAITGYGQASDIERAHAAGFDAHLVKPVEMSSVLAVVQP